jgi:hypothetical protein
MKTYQVTLTGKTPLLMHHDNIDWADFMEEWRSDPENKKTSKAGDDRSPVWRWIGCCYTDDEHIAMPAGNIMRSIMEGGAMVPVPGAKNGKTFKAQTQSGMMSSEPYWEFRCNGQCIPWKKIDALRGLSRFSEHKEAARAMGFDLMVKRARIGMQKHVRVRPMFPAGWELRGSLAVWDEQITHEALERILEFSGQYKGLGDWRPGGRTPGPYGMFEVRIS